jgi:hypothetical protein
MRSKQISGFPRSPRTDEKTAGLVRRLFQMFAALAENERDVIREHTIAALSHRRAPATVKVPAGETETETGLHRGKMLADSEMTIKEVAEVLGVNRAKPKAAGYRIHYLHWPREPARPGERSWRRAHSHWWRHIAPYFTRDFRVAAAMFWAVVTSVPRWLVGRGARVATTPSPSVNSPNPIPAQLISMSPCAPQI